MDTPKVISERVDDIPLLLAQLERMGVASVLDTHFKPNGNWQGLSFGKVLSVWLSHMLSESDHRLNHVEAWSLHRIETLIRCMSAPVRSHDFTDDRLGSALRLLSDDECWDAFERDMGAHLVRVYDLSTAPIRLDSTAVSGYFEVSKEGMFQFGHSKDHRPDLPQVKVMLSTLDPLGLPIGCEVLSGECADDKLYIPAIERVRNTYADKRGLFYIGDTKMASIGTRAFIAGGDDFYLCPLPKRQLSAEALDAYLLPVLEQKQPLEVVKRESVTGQIETIAQGYEVSRDMTVGDKSWIEKHLVVHSFKLASSKKNSLDKRLAAITEKLLKFNDRKQGKKCYRSKEELQPRVEEILQKQAVSYLLDISYKEESFERPVRAYKDKPARIKKVREVFLDVSIKEEAYQAHVKRLGWRVYASNMPELSLEKAILAYREEFVIERNFARLKGKPLSLRPMYLQREDHIIGLIRLLSIALRVVVLIEYQLRQQLAKKQRELSGLYAGNPNRKTTRPTTEQALKAFQYLTLTIIDQQQQTICHLTELNQLQKNILELLNFSVNIYTKLAFPKPG